MSWITLDAIPKEPVEQPKRTAFAAWYTKDQCLVDMQNRTQGIWSLQDKQDVLYRVHAALLCEDFNNATHNSILAMGIGDYTNAIMADYDAFSEDGKVPAPYRQYLAMEVWESIKQGAIAIYKFIKAQLLAFWEWIKKQFNTTERNSKALDTLTKKKFAALTTLDAEAFAKAQLDVPSYEVTMQMVTAVQEMTRFYTEFAALPPGNLPKDTDAQMAKFHKHLKVIGRNVVNDEVFLINKDTAYPKRGLADPLGWDLFKYRNFGAALHQLHKDMVIYKQLDKHLRDSLAMIDGLLQNTSTPEGDIKDSLDRYRRYENFFISLSTELINTLNELSDICLDLDSVAVVRGR